MFQFDPGVLILCFVVLILVAAIGAHYFSRYKYKNRDEESAIRGSELQEMIDRAVSKALAEERSQQTAAELDSSKGRMQSEDEPTKN